MLPVFSAVVLSASSGLKELGFNSLWSDPSPTLGYLIVVMIICVLKTSMAPCCSLFARDPIVRSAE